MSRFLAGLTCTISPVGWSSATTRQMAATPDLADVGLESPLIERAPGEAVARVLSLDRWRPCNDAAVEAGPPVSAALPSVRWAYGLLFPLDHAAPKANPDRPIVVSCDLVVEAGHVGIMGVAEGLERPTTKETVIGPGRTTACLTLNPPTRTSAIVLRNVGEAGIRPRVTVSAVGAYQVGPPRLAPRRHDLRFDLFVVLAPEKTATQTVEQTLLTLAPGIQVRRAHGISEDAFAPFPLHVGSDAPVVQSRKKQIDYGRALEREIGTVRTLGGRIAFVTAVREPIDQAIAALFEKLPDNVRAFRELHAVGPAFVDLLATGLVASWRRESRGAPEESPASGSWFWASPHSPSQFFGGEFPHVTGVDLLAQSVDRVAGFTLVQQYQQAVLMFRYEDIARGLGAGLAALTGQRHIALRDANRADDKPYAALYREFRARFRIPTDLAMEIYDRDQYLRHFYTEEELTAFKAKWTAPQPLGPPEG